MRILILIFTITFFSNELIAQDISTDEQKGAAVTVGILQGGGSLLGVDFEVLVSDQIGVQIGGGLVGFGTGLNFHIKPAIRSSFISLQYWHQGAGDSFAQNIISGNFVFRSKKWFTCQIGFGKIITQGSAMPDRYKNNEYMLTYAIGAYFPV